MKKLLLFSILFCVMAIPIFAELRDADLDEIRLIVNEEVKKEVTASETRMKEYIEIKNDSIEKRLSLVTSLIVGLMALIGIPLVALTVMIGWRSVKDGTPEIKNIRELTREEVKELVLEQMTELTSEDKRAIEQLIRDQEQKIESLTQEIETLKQQTANL